MPSPRKWRPAKLKASGYRPTLGRSTVPLLLARPTEDGFRLIGEEDTRLWFVKILLICSIPAFFIGVLTVEFMGLGLAGWLLGMALALAVAMVASRDVRSTVMRLLSKRKLADAELLVSAWPLRPGDQARLIFRRTTKGSAVPVRMGARLLCREIATKRTGRDSHETKEETVFETSFPEDMHPKRVDPVIYESRWDLRIPPDAMQSMRVNAAEVSWELRTRTVLEDGTDVGSTFELLVLPGPPPPWLDSVRALEKVRP